MKRTTRKSALERLSTPDPIWKPYKFDRVTVRFEGRPVLSLVAPVYSEYSSGPALTTLADTAGELLGRPGYFGLESCRALGWRA